MTNIEIKINSMLQTLNNSEKKVASYLLDNIHSIFSMPVASLAKESGVSQVTWVRFCKLLGYEGLKDLKRNLFLQLNNETLSEPLEKELIFADLTQSNSLEQIAQTIKISSTKAIEDTMKMVHYEELSTIIDLIDNASKIQLFGVGASGIIADDFYRKLIRIGKNVHFSYDTHTQITYGANLSSRDVAIFFSYSGNTSEILEILEYAKLTSCPTIAITKFAKSPLVAGTHHAIYISAPEVDLRSGAMSSRLAQLTIIDLLFTGLASKNYSSVEKYLENSYQACKIHKK